MFEGGLWCGVVIQEFGSLPLFQLKELLMRHH